MDFPRVTNELRYELSTSYELRYAMDFPRKCTSYVRVQIHELRVQIHELRVQIHELLVQIHELGIQIHELRVQIHESPVQIREFKNHKINENSSKQPSNFY